LGAEVFDLLVVGGGITGSGIARDAAGRGLRVCLLEAGDIGGATSSSSSRLVHGGLRYLEAFEFGLVFEALRERRRLLELAPHLVRPLPFLLPVFHGDSPGLPKLAAGMMLYETLSLFRSPQRHRILGTDEALEAEPMLRSTGLSGGALYYDAQVDDARLTLAVARGAREAGAVVLSYVPVVRIAARGRAETEVTIRDRVSKREFVVRGKLVVNATGPWSDRLRRLADPSVAPRLRTTKGAHILVPRDRVGNRNAVIFRSIVDDRVMFVLPWGTFTYVGTTDTEFDGDPSTAVAEPDDIRYLLNSANGIFPAATLTPADVISTWAGVRPLLAPERSNELSASATSREHAIWRDRCGLLNIAGGKLTTFRSMAAEAGSAAASILSKEFGVRSGDFHTEFLPVPGAPHLGVEELVRTLRPRAGAKKIDVATLEALIGRHGADTERLLDLIDSDPTLGSRLVPELTYIRAEVLFAVREEMAVTVEDVLRRRLHIFYETWDGGVSIVDDVVGILRSAPLPDWDLPESSAQIQRYEEAVRRTRPSSPG
jgi:glycerol-3-phosphate dehydrogenase